NQSDPSFILSCCPPASPYRYWVRVGHRAEFGELGWVGRSETRALKRAVLGSSCQRAASRAGGYSNRACTWDIEGQRTVKAAALGSPGAMSAKAPIRRRSLALRTTSRGKRAFQARLLARDH